MKKITKAVSSALLSFMICASLCISAFAADSSVTFNGHDEGFSFAPGSEYTSTDLFDSFKDCMPGDTLTETISVTNDSDDSDYIKMFVRAEAYDEVDNPLSDKVAESETIASMQDFLSQLHMKVYNGDALIFDASPDELDGMADNVLLGTFRKGESTTLTVELDVPDDLGNEYAKRVGEVTWVFLTEAYDDPEPPVDDDLIQTGSLSWLVPVLAIPGALMIAFGAIVIFRSKETENA